MTSDRCNKETFEFRTYYYCDLIKGHRGNHKCHDVYEWSKL